MPHYTYVLHSNSKDRYYIESSSDIAGRLARHNAGATPSSKAGRPWIIVYTEQFQSKSEAIKRELALKKLKSRLIIKRLIDNSSKD